MGDIEVISPLPKGVDGVSVGYSSPPSHPPNPNPSTIDVNIWLLAEQATQKVIRHMQPTVVSEHRRKIVVEYVQRLIKGFVSSEVFPYGSVPLKTYLPDGDIDLTAIGIPNSEDALASDVRSILEGEELNKDSEFEVKDVQYIHAEVKLVKCLVQNIVVDISFNQLGGLCTLCFLEQVDRFIGKEHLFKRSIILIKAWCYYESRILGAHHGLISTYALETLVLYIFHLFHSSLNAPLAVLYRFLDYYSKFDWDKYCISLQGPVSLSSFPEVSAFDNDGGDLLLTEEFLRNCVDSFSVPVRGSEASSRTFSKKHLNIIDPLRENNNLGRSVSKGNFYRIRSAFTYGSRKLGRLLLQPAGNIGDEVIMFFMNTMDRHGGGERPDVQDFVPRSPALVESAQMDIVQSLENLEKDELSLEHLASKDYGDLNKEMKNIKISSFDGHEERVALQKYISPKQQNSTSGEVNGISSERLTNDAKDLATSSTFVSRNKLDSPKSSSLAKEDGILDFRNAYHAPHLFFQQEKRTTKDIKLNQINPLRISLSYTDSSRDLISNGESSNLKHSDSRETDLPMSSTTGRIGNFGDGYPSERLYLLANNSLERNIANHSNGPSSSSLDEMSDLSGDFELHMRSLGYALWCQEQIINTYFVPMHRAPPYSYYRHGKDMWARGNMFTTPLSPRPPFPPAGYSMNLPYISASYTTEEAPKPRGTGTYFPNMNYHAYREKNSPGRVKNAVFSNHLPRPQNNGHVDVSQDMGSLGKGSHEAVIQPQLVLGGRGRLPARLDAPQSPSRPAFKAPPNANGIIIPSEFGRLEFGSLGHATVDAPSKELRKKPEFLISNSHHGSGFTNSVSSSPRPATNSNKGRTMPSYQLKDEDFPPLSG